MARNGNKTSPAVRASLARYGVTTRKWHVVAAPMKETDADDHSARGFWAACSLQSPLLESDVRPAATVPSTDRCQASGCRQRWPSVNEPLRWFRVRWVMEVIIPARTPAEAREDISFGDGTMHDEPTVHEVVILENGVVAEV